MKKTLSLLVFLALLSFASAIPQIPEAYDGVAYVNGEIATSATEVSVRSASGDEWKTQVISDGLWSLDVTFDDPDTSSDEGARTGEQLTWFIGGVTASLGGMTNDIADFGGQNSGVSLTVGPAPSAAAASTTISDSEGVSPTSTSTLKVISPATTSTLQSSESTSTMPSEVDPSQTTVPGAISNLLAKRETTTTLTSEIVVSSSCFDGVRNNGEVGVDCGGPCPPCEEGGSNLVYLILGASAVLVFLLLTFILLVVVFIVIKKKKKQ
ncbi:MAG: hypothetical protein ABH851_01725 [Methanobacteriota archaeon]